MGVSERSHRDDKTMADDAPKVLGGTAIRPKERHGWEAVKYLLYNPETGEVLTRTPKSWALITVFYLIYYSCLAAFWAAMMAVFLQTLPTTQAQAGNDCRFDWKVSWAWSQACTIGRIHRLLH